MSQEGNLLNPTDSSSKAACTVWCIFYRHIRDSVDQKGVKKGNVMKFLLHFVPLNVFLFFSNESYVQYLFVFYWYLVAFK